MIQKYDIGLLDCPWQYDNQQQNDPNRGGITYPQLSMKELAEIPIENMFNDNALLFVWVTFPKLCDQYYEKYDPLSIIRAWGFRPLTAAFVWIKTNKHGRLITDDTDVALYDDWYSGLGRYTNSNAEFCIVARRGKSLERSAKNVKQLIFAPIAKHSEKPETQYFRIDNLYSPERYKRIELFARSQNPPPKHWDATGLDYDGRDIREVIKQYD